jgi:hypothetical protein
MKKKGTVSCPSKQPENIGVRWQSSEIVGYVEIPRHTLNARIQAIHYHCPDARISLTEAQSDTAIE